MKNVHPTIAKALEPFAPKDPPADLEAWAARQNATANPITGRGRVVIRHDQDTTKVAHQSNVAFERFTHGEDC